MRPAAVPLAATAVLFLAGVAAGTGGTHTIAGGEEHTHPFDLPADTYLELRIEQRGADLEAHLDGPDGTPLLAVDSPTGNSGAELLAVVGRRAGEHTLRVRAFDGSGGRYRLHTVARRPATAADRRRAALFAELATAEALRRTGETAAALAAYRALEPAALDAGVPFLAGEARDRRGRLLDRAGRGPEAVEHFAAAEDHYAAAGETARRAGAAARRGQALLRADRPRAARDALRLALELRTALAGGDPEGGDLRGIAFLHHSLGDAHQSTGEPQRALDHYSRALALWRRVGDRREEGITLHNLGTLHSSLGQSDAALDHLERAATIWRQGNDQRRLAVTLDKLALLHLDRGDPAGALAELRRALELRDSDPEGRAVTLNHVALVHRKRGDLLTAAAVYRSALATLRDADRAAPRTEAALLHNLAVVEERAGRPADAVRRHRRALALYRQLGDPAGEASTLSSLARAHHRLGDAGAALGAVRAATALFESQRTRPRERQARIAYFATFQEHYELHVDLLMQRHRADPTAGHGARALEVAEQARARSLLDLLAAGSEDSDDGDEDGDPPGAALPVRELRDRLLRGAGPPTALLEYKLGNDGSHLWVLTADRLESHALPPRRVLEATAHRLRAALTRSHRREGRAAAGRALCAASRQLLAPAAEGLRGVERLIVVGDGALAALPFAALPEPGHPCANAPPLLVGRTVTQPPSASFAAANGRQASPAGNAIAVFADPAYPAGDPARPPLPASRREAGAIRAAATATTASTVPVTVFLGADATRHAARTAASGHRVLHFATHAAADPDHPDAGALLLTPMAGDGGRLTAGEIHHLELGADLVVLSACRTAVGRQVRGEGMLGLGRAFLSAGAHRVLVSLWDVDDAATAALMRRFYTHLLGAGGHPPRPAADALAAAQRSLAADPRWAAPYHWAGFVLQG